MRHQTTSPHSLYVPHEISELASNKSNKKKKQNPKLSNSLNRSLRTTHTQDLVSTTQLHHTHEPTHAHPQEEE